MIPLLIDNFAGGGGASTGIERALGRPVDVAINHDPEALAMHAANHSETRHLCQSIMAVDPIDATGGAPVALVWFSPDCKHHSKAKGGKPREKNIRDLAWVVPHWVERLQDVARRPGDPAWRRIVRVIILENVEEFRKWGPLDAEGQPIKERQGEEFDLWVCAHMEQANTGAMVGREADKPLTTITGSGSQQRLVETTLLKAGALPPKMMERATRVAAFLIKYYGAAAHGQAADQPLDAITAKARFAVVTVTIDATTYVIVDIGMRMLQRRELANAQGFPPDYELAPLCDVARRDDGTWRALPHPRPLPVSSSIRMIGNSVCPDMAEALARANVADIIQSAERTAA